MGIIEGHAGIASYTTFRGGIKYRLERCKEPPEGTPDDVVAEAVRNGLKVLARGEKPPPPKQVDIEDVTVSRSQMTVGSTRWKRRDPASAIYRRGRRKKPEAEAVPAANDTSQDQASSPPFENAAEEAAPARRAVSSRSKRRQKR